VSDYRAQIMKSYGEVIVDATRTIAPEDYARSARRFRRVYTMLSSIPRTARVLDVGCGDGQFLHFLKTLGFTQLRGFDTSENQLEKCRKYATRDVENGDAFDWLARHPAAFDLVVCNHLIEHIPDAQLLDFVGLLVGAVAPGGALLITTPNGWSPWAGFLLFTDLTHVRLHTPDSLTQLLGLQGFDVALYGEGAVAYDVPTTLRWILWKIREAMLRFDFRIQVGGSRGSQKVPFIVTPHVIAVARRKPAAGSAVRS
jgi:SAM-dependent methyltransferase